MMTRVTPLSSQPRTVFISRTPPPSCIFIVSPERIAPDRLGVDGRPGKGAVEVDDMEIFEPLVGERPRLRGGVAC